MKNILNTNNRRIIKKVITATSYLFVVFSVVTLFNLPQAQAATTVASSTASVTTSAGLQFTSLTVDDKEDFVVEPGKMEVHANPGDTITQYISITSRIAKPTEFSVSSEDFVGSTDETNPVVLLGASKSPFSLKDWLLPASSDFLLHFGTRVTLPVTISVPKDATPGGYYAAVIVSNAPQVNADTVTTAGIAKIISRIGVLFFVRVNGTVNTSGQLEDFRANPSQSVYSVSPTDFKILFNNNGSVYLAPYGEVHVYNFFGSEVANLPVDAYFSLPNALRYRDVLWNDNSFRIGRYTATVNLNRSYDNVIDTKTIVFWVLPWKVIMTFFVGLVVIAFVIYYFLSRFEFRRKK